jgi:hypothetical protein
MPDELVDGELLIGRVAAVETAGTTRRLDRWWVRRRDRIRLDRQALRRRMNVRRPR